MFDKVLGAGRWPAPSGRFPPHWKVCDVADAPSWRKSSSGGDRRCAAVSRNVRTTADQARGCLLLVGPRSNHDDEMFHNVVTLNEAINSGFSARRVLRLVERREWQRLYPGIYLTRPHSVATTEPERMAAWKSQLAGLLLHAGEGAIVSHLSAAKLHEFEGIEPGYPLEVTVPPTTRRSTAGVHRSAIADSGSVTFDGLRTTSIVRTLRDVAARCEADALEQMLESVLRGPDPRRPDQWSRYRLIELRESVERDPRLRGSYVLRTVLRRRTDDDRPTGSFPETLLFQAVRSVGFTVLRQVTLRIVDRDGYVLDVFFPDLFIPEYRLIIEVDGTDQHSGAAALQRDLRRQNKLIKGFRILRFTAVEVLADPAAVGERIRRAVAHLPASESTWTVDGVAVSYSPNLLEVVDFTRNAKEEAMERGRRPA